MGFHFSLKIALKYLFEKSSRIEIPEDVLFLFSVKIHDVWPHSSRLPIFFYLFVIIEYDGY